MPVTFVNLGDSDDITSVARLVLERGRVVRSFRRLDRVPALSGVKLLRDEISGVRAPEEELRPKAGDVMDLSFVSYGVDQCMTLAAANNVENEPSWMVKGAHCRHLAVRRHLSARPP